MEYYPITSLNKLCRKHGFYFYVAKCGWLRVSNSPCKCYQCLNNSCTTYNFKKCWLSHGDMYLNISDLKIVEWIILIFIFMIPK